MPLAAGLARTDSWLSVASDDVGADESTGIAEALPPVRIYENNNYRQERAQSVTESSMFYMSNRARARSGSSEKSTRHSMRGARGRGRGRGVGHH